MKDLVKRPQQKYDTLFRELQRQGVQNTDVNPGASSNDPANDAMKNELKRYLMELNATVPEPESSSIPNSSLIELGSAYQ